ncbi:MAG: Fic family protein [Candidatus Micrarchaeota archaeon]
MRKFDILKMLFESTGAASPNDISKKTGISLPNVYTYLKELAGENLIQKTHSGTYIVNKANEKLRIILDLQAMTPERFHLLLTPTFRDILTKLCHKLPESRKMFSQSQINRMEHIAIPLRIVLRLSKRPSAYCLKINEALVSSLLEYHDLKPSYNLIDFQKTIERTDLTKSRISVKPVESEPEVVRICDQAYSANADIEVLSKSSGFVPDQRLNDLLKNADQVTKEYLLFLNALDEPIRAALFDQWERKYIYNTNSIEGNTMSEKDVDRYLKNGKRPERISKRELHETSNIRHALRFLKLKVKEDISEGLIQELHFMVQKDIADNPGEYKRFYNYVKPSSPTTPPQHVKERMRILIEWYAQNKDTAHPFVLASIFHMEFEMIHPFEDGNGRVGRLLMNHILKQRGYLPITILEKSKQNYYRALENRSLPQFLGYTLASFIEEYRR